MVSPSPRAAQVLLEVGWETVKVFPFPETLERGQTVGATGGTVTSADGVELVVPEGAVPVRTPVEVRGLAADEIAALPAVAGFDTVAAVRIDLDGRTLAREATLKLAVPAGVATDAAVVLAEWMEFPADGRGGYARLASRMGRSGVAGSAGERLVGAPEAAGSALPLEGIVREGLYLVLVAQDPIGYATGFVRSASGLGLADSRVTATGLGTADLSRPGGRYAVPVPVNPGAVLTAQHPSLDERATAGVPALVAGEVVVVDLQVIPVPPTVTGLQPADGALDVTVGANLQVTFSEALDPATVGEGTLSLEVADASGRGTGAYVPGTVSLVNGATVLFQPTLALPAGYPFVAHFAGGVRDAGGVPYQDGPVDWRFTTSTVAAPGGQVHPELFHITIPVDGVSRIWADPGAVPDPQWTISPILVNTATAPITVGSYSTSSLAPDALVPITIGEPPTNPVTLDSEVWVRIFDHTGTLAETFRLGPFASEDGLAFVAPAGEPTTFTTAEGIEVEVPEGAFDEATLVRVTKLDREELGVDAGLGLELAAYLDIDFDGRAAESLVLKVPAPEGIADDATVLVGAPEMTVIGRRLRLLDLGGVVVAPDGSRWLSNDLSVQPPIPNLAGSGAKSGDDDDPFPGRDDGTITIRIRSRQHAAFFSEMATSISLATFMVNSSVASQFEMIYNLYADQWFFLPPPTNWSGQVVLPVPEGTQLEVVRRDGATGWLVGSLDYGDPLDPDGDGIVVLPPFMNSSSTPPEIVDADPFQLIRFSPPEVGDTARIRLDLEATTLAGGTLTVESNTSFHFEEGGSVAVHTVSRDGSLSEARGPRFYCAGAGTRLTTTIGSADEVLVSVGPGGLDATASGPLRFHFDRPIDAWPEDASSTVAKLFDVGSTEHCDATESRQVPVRVSVEGAQYTILVVEPLQGLQAGRRYRLELTPHALFQGSGHCSDLAQPCAGPKTYLFSTRKPAGAPIASGGSVADAVDMMRFGNLMMVGTRSGELKAVDVSTGAASGGPGDYREHASLASGFNQVRAFATDGHGRLFFAARIGGMWSIKALAIETVRNTPPGGAFTAAEGGVRVAYALGSDLGSEAEELAFAAMPYGTPVGLEIVTRDEISETQPLDAFYEDVTGNPFDLQGFIPDEKGFVTVAIPIEAIAYSRPDGCDNQPDHDRFQRVSVDNLTTGQTWSVDVAVSEDGSSATVPLTVLGRLGDQFRMRHNLQAIGVVAILGSGLTVVDVNRFYRQTMVATPGLAQCGRRLGKYEGEENMFPGCGAPGLRFGIDMSPAVALLGDSGCEPEGCEYGNADVTTFSPVTHVGLFGASAPMSEPGTLSPMGFNCLQTVSTDVGGASPTGLPVWLRDVAVAQDVEWLSREIRARTPDRPCGATDPDTHQCIDWPFQVDNGGDADHPFEAFDPQILAEPAPVTGDLLFVSLGEAGILVYDVTSRDLSMPIGHLHVPGHSIYRLQVDAPRGLLLAGGTSSRGPIVDVWSIRGVSSASYLVDDSDRRLSGVGLDSRPIATLEGMPWGTDHLGLDEDGTGLLFTVGSSGGVEAVPFTAPKVLFAGLYATEDEDQGLRELRLTETLVPLGVPTEVSATEERDNQRENERWATAAFKLRLALPGAFGETLTARVQSLRVLPPEGALAGDVGAAVAPTPPEGWPDSQVTVTLRRLSGTGTGENGPFGPVHNLYESDEVVLVLADPRAAEDYTLEGAEAEIVSEAGQCRRCERPSILTEDDEVVELLATGRYLRAWLDLPDPSPIRDYFDSVGDGYPVPSGAAELLAWADAVPSPAQVSLAEPVLNAAIWAPGEAGASVALASGDALLESVDHQVPARGLGFSLERSYRSGTLGMGPFGVSGWHGSLWTHLRQISTTGEVEYHDGRGHAWRFFPVTGRQPCSGSGCGGDEDADGDFWATAASYDPEAAGSYYAPKGLYVTLRRTTGGWEMIDRHGSALRFDRLGRLAEVSDRFRGPEDENAAGNTIHLRYDALGQLAEVEDELGRRYTFTYDEDPESDSYGLLTKVEDFARFGTDGSRRRTVEYAYEDGLLTEVRLPEIQLRAPGGYTGRPNVAYTYDPVSNVSASDGASTGVLHGRFARLRLEGYKQPPAETGDPLRVRFEYDGGSGRTRAVAFPDNEGVNATGARWELPSSGPDLQPTEVDVRAPWVPTPHTLTYELDHGRPTRVVSHDTPIHGAEPGEVATSYAYTDDGRLLVVGHPDGSATTYCFGDEGGEGCSEIPAMGETFRSARPNVLATIKLAGSAVTGPGAGTMPDSADYDRITQQAGYSQGNNLLSSLSDGLDRRVDIGVPLAGQSATTEFSEETVGSTADYDQFGRATNIVGLGDDGPRSSFQFGDGPQGAGSGLMTGVGAGGVDVSVGYDGGTDVPNTVSGFGLETRTANDEWDRPYRILSGPTGQVPDPAEAFDCNPTSLGGAVVRAVERGYDAAGHVAFERVCQDVVAVDGNRTARWVETQYDYDDREQLRSVYQSWTAPADPDDTWDAGLAPVLTHEYLPDGRLERRLEEGGASPKVVTTYGYDTAGRVNSVQTGVSSPRTQAYDAMGRVVHSSDGDETFWAGRFDAWGRLYREELPTGAVILRWHDAADNVVKTETYDRDPETDDEAKRLAASGVHITSFGEIDRTVELIEEREDGTVDVLVTQRSFDSSGRTVLVVSGPAEQTDLLPDLLDYTIACQDIDPAPPEGPQRTCGRREVEIAYEPFTGRVLEQRFGGIGATGIDDYEHGVRSEYVGSRPWPEAEVAFERIPGGDVVDTLTTEYLDRDPWGRPTAIRRSDGSTVTLQYDRSGDLLESSTGAGTTERFVYDGRGLLLEHVRPAGRGRTAYGYDRAGRPLVESVRADDGAELWRTVSEYDASGRLDLVRYHDATVEDYEYNPDDTLDHLIQRDGVRLDYAYDVANQVTQVVPSAGPGSATLLDGGDRFDYDELSRPKAVTRLGQPATHPANLAITGYDLAGRPVGERVGEREALGWTYDIWSRPTHTALPLGGLGDDGSLPINGYERGFDTLDRVLSVAGVGAPQLGADWVWGGSARLWAQTTRGPRAVSTRYTYYGAPDAFQPPGADTQPPWQLAALVLGSGLGDAVVSPETAETAWGAFGFGWRGFAGGGDGDGAKVGRMVLADGAGLVSGMGWSWTVNDQQRLLGAHSGPGALLENDDTSAFESFGFGYGDGDQLESLSRSTGGVTNLVPGAYGRIAERNGRAFGYDGAGRRTADDRFEYRWDWRGQLRQVDVQPTWPDGEGGEETPADAGHRVTYEYDAAGRLLERVDWGPEDGDGLRAVHEVRRYLWDGQSLLAEAGFGSTDGTTTNLAARWRATYVPGPSGLDDQVQVYVEDFLEETAATYALVRDELGSVVAVVRECDPCPAGDASPFVLRYLYTPYGEAHAERGPELRAAFFDRERTAVETPGGPVEQVLADPEGTAPGALELSLSLPPDPASLTAGIELRDLDEGRSWTEGTDYVIGLDAEHPERLHLLALAGWPVGHDLELRLTTAVTDRLGRRAVHAQVVQIGVAAPGSVSVAHDRLGLDYDSIAAALAGTVTCRFEREGGGDPIEAACFPGGQSLLFHGLWTDPITGLAYARARWYDPRNASWLSEDPVGPADSTNLYAYVGWGPHAATDPTGEIALVDNLIGGVFSVIAGVAIEGVVSHFDPEHEFDYSWQDAAVDFGLGFATSGLSTLSKGAKLSRVARVAVEGTANFAVDIIAEDARCRMKGQSCSGEDLAKGAFQNFLIGQAGSLASEAVGAGWKRLRSGRLHNPFDMSDIVDGAKQGVREGAAATARQFEEVASRMPVRAPRGGGINLLRQGVPDAPTFSRRAIGNRVYELRPSLGGSGANRWHRVNRWYNTGLPGIEEHHLINKAQLTGKNPHPFALIAKQQGVDITTAQWNLRTMAHRGGHTADYYQQVRQRLDALLVGYQRQGSNWGASAIERKLMSVASGISHDIDAGTLRLYRYR